MSGRLRADRLLVERGLFESRAKAQAAIEAGLVQANGTLVRKAAEEIPTNAKIDAQPAHPYVSRGGVKLTAALAHFDFDPKDRICLDVGASTGGFTEVLLQRGSKRIYAVDVGKDQLHPSLRAAPRIVSLEQTDIRKLDPTRLDPKPDFAVVDVSFISLKLIVPALAALLAEPARLVALIKPQFEIGPGVALQGVDLGMIADEIRTACEAQGWRVAGVVPSPIEGGDGNREFLLGATRD